MIRLHADGRGRHYTPVRGLLESAARLAYGGGWAAALWGALPGTTGVQLLHHRLAILEPGASPLRVGFISDIHLGPTTPTRTVDNAFELLRGLELDVLALGGDYVFLDATADKLARLTELVASVAARTKVAVLGNHDLWTHHGQIERALSAAGARVLVDATIRLPGPHRDIAVVGLDDPWTGSPDPARAFAEAHGAATRLVVCHAPDALPLVEGRDAALLLCGHTHGGHVALPGRPLVVPGAWGKRYPHGLHHHGGLPVFVSRGVGGTEVPVRTWAPPDVALFELVAAERAHAPAHSPLQ